MRALPKSVLFNLFVWFVRPGYQQHWKFESTVSVSLAERPGFVSLFCEMKTVETLERNKGTLKRKYMGIFSGKREMELGQN